MNIKHLSLFSVCLSAMFAASSHAQLVSVVNDDFTVSAPDSSNNNTDADYFGSSSTSALEFGANFVGLVSGTSGRTMHALYPTQTLGVIGDTIVVSATFTTPATVATTGEELRIGIFDNLGRTGTGQLGQNTEFSGATPNLNYNGLAGHYSTIDVEAADPSADLDVRAAEADNGQLTGTFLASSGNFEAIVINGSNSGPSFGYAIVPNTSYTITFSVERIAGTDATNPGDELSIATELFEGQTSIASHTVIDLNPLSFSYGMFGAQAGGDAVGSNNTATDQADVALATNDNGIDFTSLTVDADLEAGVIIPPVDAGVECAVVPNGEDDFTVICP